MAAFTVNGQTVESGKNQKLLRFLRDELHLTSVKDGCSEGACGACTVIIDGRTCKACVPDTDSLEGKNVITVEGLTDWEEKVYTYAYGKAGAVQCGFCIPGMIMCTKALLDVNKEPTDEEIKYALRNNYCRCTGYVKIIDAVRIAAGIMREGVIPQEDENWELGSRVARIDVGEKVLGTGKYPDDFYPEGMLYGVALRSKYPRARVLSIDTTKAEQLPGVEAVVTAKDIPGENKIGHLKHDQYTLIPVGGLTHYLGDAIALVAAKDRETAEKAKKLIKVEYEVLPHIHTIEEAAAPDAPRVFDEEENNICAYKHISRGNATEAIEGSKYVISKHFETPWTEHAFLEPECAVSFYDEDGDIFIYSTDQSAHQTLHECSLLLGTDKVNTSAGVKAIKKLEKADVSEVETKISNIEKEEKQATEDWQNRPLSEKFAHAVILGDSITTGFTVYDVLDTSKVVAEKGMHLDQTGDLIRTAAELKPEVLFLALGLNDISGTDGDTDAFIEKYKAVLANVREQMPDAVLYINCVLPVSAQKEEEEPVYAKIPDYNTALKAMCDEEEITFIDNTEIVKDEYYEQDGEHMKAEYYPIWAEHMAEVAGI